MIGVLFIDKLIGSLTKQDICIWNGTHMLLRLRHGHYLQDLVLDGAKYGLSAIKSLLESSKFEKSLQNTFAQGHHSTFNLAH